MHCLERVCGLFLVLCRLYRLPFAVLQEEQCRAAMVIQVIQVMVTLWFYFVFNVVFLLNFLKTLRRANTVLLSLCHFSPVSN